MGDLRKVATTAGARMPAAGSLGDARLAQTRFQLRDLGPFGV